MLLAEWFALNEPAYHIKCPNGLVKWQDVSTVSDHDLLEVQDFSGVAGDFLANLPNASICSPVIADSTLVGPSKNDFTNSIIMHLIQKGCFKPV